MSKQNAIHRLLLKAAEPSAVISHRLFLRPAVLALLLTQTCLHSPSLTGSAEEQAGLTTSYVKKPEQIKGTIFAIVGYNVLCANFVTATS